MEEDKLDILLIEDNHSVAKLFDIYLNEAYGNGAYTLSIADSLLAGIRFINAKSFNIILLDLTLPDSSGLDTFKKIFAKSPSTPIIVVTGFENETIALDTMKLGAQDFLIKGKITGKELKRSINYSIERNILLKELSIKTNKLEERTHEEELDQLATAATKSFNSVVIANKNGEIEWVNEGFTRLSGYKYEEISHGEKSLFKIIRDTQFPKGKFLNEYTFSKIPFSYERECLTKDGKKYWVISTITPVLDKTGGIEKIIAIDTDITERKHIEEELVRTSKIKEEFLANMSHEIRTPMNAIVGFTDLLLKTELSQDQKQYIDAVKTSGRNLIVIINDILDFSKIESGKITFEQIEFDLRSLISTLTELMLPKSMEKNIRISTKIDKRISSQLIGDPTRLNQIFLNLVGNAIKFTEKGEVKVTADFISEDKDRIELKFTVTDTGIGIPEDKLDCVFEGFTQAKNDTNRKYGGTGLGLTIVKQLVELQGGTISVNSKFGFGSSFSFNFKFKKTLPDEVLKRMSADKKPELAHIEKLNILLVEDNLLNQILAKKVLNNWKWNVEVADNGLIALHKLKNASYDIVLMDIMMPEMDGYEATRQIRKTTNQANCNIPIIAITAHAIFGESEKCYSAGMDDYISKPFDEKVLYEKIIRVCSSSVDRVLP